MTVTFRRNYDHTWPSGAVTAFKAGWTGTVKREVEEAAGAVGAIDGSRTPRAPEPLPRNVPKLKKIARDEGIDVGEATTADEFVAAIEAARLALSAPPSPTSATPAAPGAPISSAPPLPEGDNS